MFSAGSYSFNRAASTRNFDPVRGGKEKVNFCSQPGNNGVVLQEALCAGPQLLAARLKRQEASLNTIPLSRSQLQNFSLHHIFTSFCRIKIICCSIKRQGPITPLSPTTSFKKHVVNRKILVIPPSYCLIEGEIATGVIRPSTMLAFGYCTYIVHHRTYIEDTSKKARFSQLGLQKRVTILPDGYHKNSISIKKDS